MCRVIMSFAKVYHVGVWFRFNRSALRLAVALCWVEFCFDSWVLPGSLCFLRITQRGIQHTVLMQCLCFRPGPCSFLCATQCSASDTRPN